MKRKELTKTIAMLLASCLCLSACGSAVDSGASKESSVSTVSTQSTSGSVEEVGTKNYWEMLDEVSDTSELPDWTGDKLEVSIWMAAGSDASFGEITDTNVVLKEIERVTGITFNPDECFGNGGDNIDAKLPKLVASNDFPTLVFGYDITSQLNELYDNGYLVNLTDYYQNGSLDHMLNWFPLEEMDNLIYGAMKAQNGEYFLLPYLTTNSAVGYWDAAGYIPEKYDSLYWNTYQVTPKDSVGQTTATAIYVREDILKALYPDALTTEEIKQIYVDEGSFTEEQIYDLNFKSAEDFYSLLRDIKELLESGEYAGLDGKEMEVTYGPDTGTDNWQWMTALPRLVKGFTANTDYFVTSDRSAKDGENLLQYAYLTDKYVEFMKELNELVNEDVIAQNSLVDNAASFKEKYKNGHYAVIYGQMYPEAYTIDGSEAGWQYRPVWINVPTDVDFGGYSALSTPSYWGIFKNDLTDEQIEQIIHFFDYVNSEVGIKNSVWGPASAGLFEEDAEGNRTYTNAEMAALVYDGENNGASKKYGIDITTTTERPFNSYPFPSSSGKTFFTEKYLIADKQDRVPEDALKYYNPGLLPGKSMAENSVAVKKGCQLYSLGLSVEGNKQFWAARAGFENQMKKVIVAKPEDFDKELNNLIGYAEENGLTEETLKEFNDLFVEVNRAELTQVGLIK